MGADNEPRGRSFSQTQAALNWPSVNLPSGVRDVGCCTAVEHWPRGRRQLLQQRTQNANELKSGGHVMHWTSQWVKWPLGHLVVGTRVDQWEDNELWHWLEPFWGAENEGKVPWSWSQNVSSKRPGRAPIWPFEWNQIEWINNNNNKWIKYNINNNKNK